MIHFTGFKFRHLLRVLNRLLFTVFLIIGTLSCGSWGNGSGDPGKSGPGEKRQPETENTVTKRRDDGTISSINPLDEDGYVHGVKVNFYEDGKSVHSRITYQHGRKHGPAIWYYRNGQVYEHTNFHHGRKHGLTKRYYDTGQLMEEVEYEQGEELPGKKRYNREGELLTSG